MNDEERARLASIQQQWEFGTPPEWALDPHDTGFLLDLVERLQQEKEELERGCLEVRKYVWEKGGEGDEWDGLYVLLDDLLWKPPVEVGHEQ